MNLMKNKLLSFLSLGVCIVMFSVSYSSPQLQKIGSAGPTFPIKPYLLKIAPDVGKALAGIRLAQIQQIANPPKIIKFNYLPIKSPSLTPGEVKARSIDFPQLPQPVFLVGNDQQSVNWLERYAFRLQYLHAVGLLVQAKTENDIERIKQIAPGVIIVPSSGEQIAKRFGIKHYPVLISKTTIEQ